MLKFVRTAIGLFVVATAAVSLFGAAGKASPDRRVKPPQFSEKEKAAFFTDAREKLIGERPKSGAAVQSPTPGGTNDTPSESPVALAGGSFAWSKIIEPEVIEDEIKSLQRQMTKTITTPATFKGGGYKQGRIQLSVLAVMFGIISEYDGDVRWKQQAGAIRDLLARAGFNAKVGTDASYTEAKLRKDDMESLVQGNQLQLTKNADPPQWSKVSGRPPLMSRMEQGHKDGLAIWTANSADFAKNSDQLIHEAQILAAIAEVIQREGFEFADDEEYLKLAQQVRDNSLRVVEAVKQKKYDQARTATGEIGKACTACHEGYRS
jgi:cytochrome c556